MFVTNEIHNFCEVEIYDKGVLINKAKGYNTAFSDIYNTYPYIKCAQVSGKNAIGANFSKDIRIATPEQQNSIIADLTTGWYRGNIPTYANGVKDQSAYSEYNCELWFYSEFDGYLSQIDLYVDKPGALVSSISLSDVYGRAIHLDFKSDSEILIHMHVYFKNNFSAIKRIYSVNPWKNGYCKFGLFDASFSIFGGSCGKTTKYLANGPINKGTNGFLPQVYNTGLAITKSPIPGGYYDTEVESYILQGGIVDFQKIDRTKYSSNEKQGVYINNHSTDGETIEGHNVPAWKGLIRGIIIPYVGAMDLTDNEVWVSPKNVCYDLTKVTAANLSNFEEKKEAFDMVPCYIPKRYITGGETKNLMDISCDGLIDANITVRRYYEATETKWKTHDPASKTKAFFSDLDPNPETRRCKGYSHHIPLTGEKYCGAESIIPCRPGYFRSDAQKLEDVQHYYGYFIDYSSKFGKNYKTFTLDYAVSGQVLIEDNDGIRSVITFPYILEWSEDGNIFYEACRFNSDDTPYQRKDFIQVSAPIWRVRTEGVSGRQMINMGTTHSDPYIANLVGFNINGYDPYFIFVGSKDNPDFVYETNISNPNVMSAKGDFKVKVPYLCHENDNFYLSGLTIGEYSIKI